MASSDTDRFATAKANLRDTVKWLSTLFSALAAAALGGASLVGLASVHGESLRYALWGGGIGIGCLFVAAGLALWLLASESFHISEIEQHSRLLKHLNRYASDILPPEYPDVQDFVARRTAAIAKLRELPTRSDDPKRLDAQQYLQAIDEPLTLLVSLAHFEYMRLRFNCMLPFLAVFAVGALLGLGVYAVYAGTAKEGKSASISAGPMVTLAVPQSAVSSSPGYAQACGSASPLKAELLGQPLHEWLTLRLIEPRECAGLVFSIPATLAESGVTDTPRGAVPHQLTKPEPARNSGTSR
jgi:hypothetical protein